MISTQRLLFGTFIYLGLMIILIVYLLGDGARAKYVWLPLLTLIKSITVAMANYLISSRDKVDVEVLLHSIVQTSILKTCDNLQAQG